MFGYPDLTETKEYLKIIIRTMAHKFPDEIKMKEQIDRVEYVTITLPERSYQAKAELFHRDYINEGQVIDTDLDWVFKFQEPIPVGQGVILTIGTPYQSINKAVKDVTRQLIRLRELEV